MRHLQKFGEINESKAERLYNKLLDLKEIEKGLRNGGDEKQLKEVREKISNLRSKIHMSIGAGLGDMDILYQLHSESSKPHWTPEYFVDTFINGQYLQLRKMLKHFRRTNQMEEVRKAIDNMLGRNHAQELKNWILEN